MKSWMEPMTRLSWPRCVLLYGWETIPSIAYHVNSLLSHCQLSRVIQCNLLFNAVDTVVHFFISTCFDYFNSILDEAQNASPSVRPQLIHPTSGPSAQVISYIGWCEEHAPLAPRREESKVRGSLSGSSHSDGGEDYVPVSSQPDRLSLRSTARGDMQVLVYCNLYMNARPSCLLMSSWYSKRTSAAQACLFNSVK